MTTPILVTLFALVLAVVVVFALAWSAVLLLVSRVIDALAVEEEEPYGR